MAISSFSGIFVARLYVADMYDHFCYHFMILIYVWFTENVFFWLVIWSVQWILQIKILNTIFSFFVARWYVPDMYNHFCYHFMILVYVWFTENLFFWLVISSVQWILQIEILNTIFSFLIKRFSFIVLSVATMQASC